MSIKQVDIKSVTPNGFQPRSCEDPEHVARISESIKRSGFLESEALEVVERDGGFDIVAGHHRHTAALLAGLETVPVVVVSGSERDLRIRACSSNDSNLEQKPMEQARAYDWLRSDGMDADEIAAAMCKPAGFVARRLELLKLDNSIQALVNSGNMPLTLAELIAELPTNYEQVKAVALVKNLELGAARAAVSGMIKAAAGVALPGFDDLSVVEKDKRRAAARSFDDQLKTLDSAAGSFTGDDFELALSALRSPAATVDHLNAIAAEVARVKAQVLESQGAALVGVSAPVSVRFSASVLRGLRDKLGLSVREFARAAGVDYSQLSKLESGKIRKPHPSTLRKLAAAAGVGVEGLGG